VLNLRVAATRVVPLTIRVEGESQTQEFTTAINNGFHTASILLFQGFNTLCVNTEPNQNCGASPIIEKRVLSVFADTDGDGVSDADETILGTNPSSSDSDNDGLSGGEEITRGTNPLDGDSEDDGASDGLEVLLGSNPLSAASVPNMIPTGRLLGQGGRDLLVLSASTGFFGVLGQPTLFGFGMAFDENGTLFIADNDRLRIFEPFTNVDTVVGTFGAPDGSVAI